MDIKEQLISLTPYQPGKPIEEVKKEYGLERIVKLASNENPYGCSPVVTETLLNNISKVAVYPDGYAGELRDTLARHLDVEPSQIIFGNGSDEVLQIICRALLSPGSNTVMATPTFPQYKHNAIIEGAEIREVPLLNGEHNLEGMLNEIDEHTKVVWICSPNNPTGNYVTDKNLLSFIEKVPSTTLVVIDEAYYEYVVANDYPETVPLLERFPNMMILRTFSKIYGLASLRIGYGIGNADFIKKIEPVREPFNTSRFSQVAATAAISDQMFVDKCKLKNREGIQQFIDFCDSHHVNYYPTQGNFILLDFAPLQGNEVFQYLLKHGYIVRSGNALGFPTCIRITVGCKEDNEEIISILSKMLKVKEQVS
ncbi:histidinol-phosphate transaminase [Bacillus salitolerans]|uniref:Histidinol-phosphate aminotransferase n=1 Tax=Bacillus salitolerans TaxID=1437434 RepID=A0ABW4LTZ9_9BACI